MKFADLMVSVALIEKRCLNMVLQGQEWDAGPRNWPSLLKIGAHQRRSAMMVLLYAMFTGRVNHSPHLLKLKSAGSAPLG